MARGDTLLRQWHLLRTLQSYRYGLTKQELAERLECSQRTVQRDLNALVDLFPLEAVTRDFGRRYWKLQEHALLSENLELTTTELLSLFMSQQLLLPLAGTQFGDGLHTAMQKIKALLPEKALGYFEDLDESIFIKSLAGNDYSGHSKQIRILNEAIHQRKVLKVVYRSASKGREVTSLLHPYGMVLLHASLYCIGRLECYEEVRTLKVSRITGLTRQETVFTRPDDFCLADYLQGAFGVFRSDKQIKLTVHFSGWAATNVREMQWHPSQVIEQDDGDALTASFQLGNTVEFKRWILGYGPHAKVLSPKSFVEEVKRELAEALGTYSKSP